MWSWPLNAKMNGWDVMAELLCSPTAEKPGPCVYHLDFFGW